jgi:hypothetical protein
MREVVDKIAKAVAVACLAVAATTMLMLRRVHLPRRQSARVFQKMLLRSRRSHQRRETAVAVKASCVSRQARALFRLSS